MAYPGPVNPDNRRRGQDYPYSKKTAVQWGGYNHRKAAGDMDWYDDLNMTADYAPLLASRTPFYEFYSIYTGAYHGICGGDKLYIAIGDKIYHKDSIAGSWILRDVMAVTDTDKVMCVFGNRLVVWPDKKCVTVHDDGSAPTVEDLEASEADERPTSLVISDKIFSGTYEGEPAEANCIQIEGHITALHKGDAVKITNAYPYDENNISIIIRDISYQDYNGQAFTTFHFYDNSFVIGSGQVNVVDDTGSLVTVNGYETAAQLSIKREAPDDLDILFAHENRLWGAKNKTIYASALGDPFNWSVFDGLGTDSWTLEVLDEGDFTGGCSFIGYPVFFKDNHIYKIYGSTPQDFQLVQSADLGVEPGSGKSLAIAGEKLYYLSRAGIMCYTGSLPQVISQAFGDIRYHNAVAGSDGLRYWVSLETESGTQHMFVYDTQTGIWHREACTLSDGTSAVYNGYAWHANGMYCALGTEINEGGLPVTATALHFIGEDEFAPGPKVEDPVYWYVESADFTEYSPQRKWIGPRIEVRAELEPGASFTVKVRHNNIDNWEVIGGPFANTGIDNIKKSFVCSKIPARADFYKLRIEGAGRIWIYSIAPMTDQGSSDFGFNGG